MTEARPLVLPVVVALMFGLTLPACAAPRAEISGGVQDVTRARDITSAGRLRLQSQRLAKLWLQAGLEIHASTARARLGKGVDEFDAALADLSRRRLGSRVERALARTAELWSQLKAELATPFAAGSVQRVNYLSDDLMWAAGKLAVLVEGTADTPVGRLLDLSLRQNMLAQRLAKLYLLAQAGDRSRGRLVDIEQARREYVTAFDELRGAAANTPASRDTLELARTQWIFFDAAIGEMARGDASQSPHAANPVATHVVTTSERIHEVLDAVSAQYALDYAALR